MPRDYGANARSNDDADNPWSQYRRLVLQGLTNLDQDIEKLNTRLEEFQKETNRELGKIRGSVTSLKVQAGFIGAIAGTLFSGIVIAIAELLFKAK
jgi:hypothetical protein